MALRTSLSWQSLAAENQLRTITAPCLGQAVRPFCDLRRVAPFVHHSVVRTRGGHGRVNSPISRRSTLPRGPLSAALSAPSLVLWTVQHRSVVEVLQSGRSHTASWAHVDRDFEPAYRWINEFVPGTTGNPPVWAWARVRRSVIVDGLVGEWPLLALRVPRERVLLSGFGAWHDVLNNRYCGDWFDDGTGRTEAEVTGSWVRVFDIARWDAEARKERWPRPSIQACLASITPADLVGVYTQ